MDSKRNCRLEDFTFIEFYTAIRDNDHESLGITEDKLWELTDEFWLLSKEKINSVDLQLQKISVKIALLRACLVLLIKGWDEEMADIVINLGVDIYKKTYKNDLLNIPIKIKELEKTYKIVATQRPPTPEEAKTMSAFDILARLSMNLEFGLNFQTVTVPEYLSYKVAVRSKLETLKQKR